MNYDKVTRTDGTECYIVTKDEFATMVRVIDESYVKIEQLEEDLQEATDALSRINHITEGWRPGEPPVDEMDQLDRLDELAQSKKRS